jgi:hypothetical protein
MLQRIPLIEVCLGTHSYNNLLTIAEELEGKSLQVRTI